MTRRAYALEGAAPHPRVWVWQCDVCRNHQGAPAWQESGLVTIEFMRSLGWRCLSNAQQDKIKEDTGIRLPYDTCPACLASPRIEATQ